MKPDSESYAYITDSGTREAQVSRLAAWISALRLRTLPLALSGVGMGNILALQMDVLDGITATASLSTAALLQILSNLANDLGDSEQGADGIHRVGPKRAVAGGTISSIHMRGAVWILALLSIGAGLTLLYNARTVVGVGVWIMLAAGLLATWAAIRYTMGKNPYGYAGWGDVAVWMFFGPVAVLGTTFLHSGRIEALWILPAVGLGCLSTAVLNLNNLRDREGDAQVGKRTQVVRMGQAGGLLYHSALLSVGVGSLWGHAFWVGDRMLLLFWMLPGSLLFASLIRLYRISNPVAFDPWLGRTALLTFSFVVLYLLWHWVQ